MNASYQDADVEPTLSEVMSDPIISLLMQRDGVTPLHIWILAAKVRASRSRQSEPSRVLYEPI